MRITENKLRRIIRSVIAENIPGKIDNIELITHNDEFGNKFVVKTKNKFDCVLEITTRNKTLFKKLIEQAGGTVAPVDPKEGVRGFFYNVDNDKFKDIKNIFSD